MSHDEIAPTAMISIEPYSLSVDMDGEMVAMNTDENTFFGINDLGAYIWSVIEHQALSFDALLSQLCGHYPEIDAQKIKKDMNVFLLACQDAGVLLIE